MTDQFLDLHIGSIHPGRKGARVRVMRVAARVQPIGVVRIGNATTGVPALRLVPAPDPKVRIR